MTDPQGGAATVEEILTLVADGRLGPQEADALLAALDTDAVQEQEFEWDRRDRDSTRRHARIEVTERGRSVVNVRVPMVPFSLGRYALAHVPGLSEVNADRIRDAIERGVTGPILEVQDEDGDGVRIVVE